MPNISTIELNKLKTMLIAHRTLLKKECNELLVTHGRLLVKDLVKNTAPINLGGDIRDKKIGEKAAEKDFNKFIKPFSINNKNNAFVKRFDEIKNKKDYQALNKILSNVPKLSKLTAIPFSQDEYINERTRNGDILDIKTDKNQVTLDISKLKRFKNDLMKQVGKLKASWSPAYEKLRVVVSSWIKRHNSYGYNHSSCEVKLGDDPTITIINGARPTRYLKKAIDFAVQLRVKKMTQDLINKLKGKY